MKIYGIRLHPWTYYKSLWATKELAQKEADRLNNERAGDELCYMYIWVEVEVNEQ